MDLRKLKTLIDLVSDSNVSELEITEAEGRVRIVKAPHATAVPPAPAATMPTPASQFIAPAGAEISVPAPAPAPAGKTIKSPMVGTFYRSASQGGKTMVEVGSTIQQGDPVCIIEAMKIMNEIESDVGGKVVQILCQNGQAVEFGQALLIVE